MKGHNAVILCVDDEDIPRTLRGMVLVKQGYDILPAVSAAQALDLLKQHHVDLVLTDQMMPGVVGTELARQLRATHPSLPIIIVSGVNEIPDDAVFADRFVSKVEGPEALFRNIAEVLEEYRNGSHPTNVPNCATPTGNVPEGKPRPFELP